MKLLLGKPWDDPLVTPHRPDQFAGRACRLGPALASVQTQTNLARHGAPFGKVLGHFGDGLLRGAADHDLVGCLEALGGSRGAQRVDHGLAESAR